MEWLQYLVKLERRTEHRVPFLCFKPSSLKILSAFSMGKVSMQAFNLKLIRYEGDKEALSLIIVLGSTNGATDP